MWTLYFLYNCSAAQSLSFNGDLAVHVTDCRISMIPSKRTTLFSSKWKLRILIGFRLLFERNAHQKYVKSDLAIYEKLNRFGNEEKAIRIATQKMHDHRIQGKYKPSEQIPGTTVHLLVDEIKSKINQKEK